MSNHDDREHASQYNANRERIQRVLLSKGIYSRAELLATFDADTDYTDVEGLGEVLGPMLRRCVDNLSKAEWEQAFPDLAWGHIG